MKTDTSSGTDSMEPMDGSGKVGAGVVKGATTEDCCSPAEALSSGKLTQVSPEDTGRFALLCKALGHPTRVQIVRLLMNVETCVCGDIVEKLPLAQSTVSQHLKILKDAGLVKGEIDGPRTCYALDHEALAEFRGLSDVLV